MSINRHIKIIFTLKIRKKSLIFHRTLLKFLSLFQKSIIYIVISILFLILNFKNKKSRDFKENHRTFFNFFRFLPSYFHIALSLSFQFIKTRLRQNYSIVIPFLFSFFTSLGRTTVKTPSTNFAEIWSSSTSASKEKLREKLPL